MSEGHSSGFTPQFEIEQILREAQHRWLRPVEICEILRNYNKFRIASEPPNKPPSGSLFLFDRKVLRYFRKDGHNWRKKKDGKTVKEAHEKLKTGSIDVLHCYYAHGEDENFQRRSYWMLEEELMHIVFVHYREVEGSKVNILQTKEIGAASIAYADSPACSNCSANQSQPPSLATDVGSPSSGHILEYGDSDSDIVQSSSRYNTFLEMQQYEPLMNVANACDPAPIKDHPFAQVGMDRLVNESNGGLTFTGTKTKTDMASWREIFERCSTGLQSPSFNSIVSSAWANTMGEIPEQYSVVRGNILNCVVGDAKEDSTVLDKLVSQIYVDELGSLIPSDIVVGNIQPSDVNHMKQPLDLSIIDNQDIKEFDSFSRWMSSDFGDVDSSSIPSNSGIYWSSLESESDIVESSSHNQDQLDTYVIGSSLSHNQLNIDSDDCDTCDTNLLSRFEKLLTLEYIDHSSCTVCSLMMEVDNDLLNLFKHAPDEDFLGINAKSRLLEEPLKEKLHAWLLHKVGEDGKGPNVLDKEGQGVLHLAAALGFDWAIKPVIASGVSINFRDVHGWTALHWAAFHGRERTVVTLIALGASPGALSDPTPEFPSGRTPADLASQNRYKGIAGFLAESSLVNHLRDLNLKDSESVDFTEISGLMSYHHDAKNGSSHIPFGEVQASLKESLSAVRNATEAAAQIYQVFRVQSFHRKKLIDYDNGKCIISDEEALSLFSVKNNKPRQTVIPVHTAAIKIQKKFRGWKGRKEFLSIRQHIVKIQAHVRGHQVRKHYRKILWSVGIVEKAVLRWRRKGSGLRGFRSEGSSEVHSNQNQVTNEDELDFLQEGRRQTEARLEKALARVKSMVQYPEARDQYKRLLNVVEELQDSNFMHVEISNEMVDRDVEDLMLELEGLL